jgi:hypothetical protein
VGPITDLNVLEKGKIFFPVLRFEPVTIYPAASRYTDHVTPTRKQSVSDKAAPTLGPKADLKHRIREKCITLGRDR